MMTRVRRCTTVSRATGLAPPMAKTYSTTIPSRKLQHRGLPSPSLSQACISYPPWIGSVGADISAGTGSQAVVYGGVLNNSNADGTTFLGFPTASYVVDGIPCELLDRNPAISCLLRIALQLVLKHLTTTEMRSFTLRHRCWRMASIRSISQ